MSCELFSFEGFVQNKPFVHFSCLFTFKSLEHMLTISLVLETCSQVRSRLRSAEVHDEQDTRQVRVLLSLAAGVFRRLSDLPALSQGTRGAYREEPQAHSPEGRAYPLASDRFL